MKNLKDMTPAEITEMLKTLPAIEGKSDKQIAYAANLRARILGSKSFTACTAVQLVDFMSTESYRSARDAKGATDEQFLATQFRRYDNLRYYYTVLTSTTASEIIDNAKMICNC